MGKTILDALNELVEKQGGTTEDNKLIVDAINDLVNTSGGGSSGGGLPLIECQFVEETDNSFVFQITASNYTEGNPIVVLKMLADEEEEDTYMVAEITNPNEMRDIPHIVQSGDNQIKIATTTFQVTQGLGVGTYIQMFYNEFYVSTTSGSPN